MNWRVFLLWRWRTGRGWLSGRPLGGGEWVGSALESGGSGRIAHAGGVISPGCWLAVTGRAMIGGGPAATPAATLGMRNPRASGLVPGN